MVTVNNKKLVFKNGFFYFKGQLFTGFRKYFLVKDNLNKYSAKIGYVEEELINGVVEGLCVQYYLQGQLSKKFNYKPNDNSKSGRFKVKLYGIFESYYQDGSICEKGQVFDGLLDGEYLCYYENGEPFIKANFAKGSEICNGTCFYRNGNVCQNGDIVSEYFAENITNRFLDKGKTPTYCENFKIYGIPHSDNFLEEDIFKVNSNKFSFIYQSYISGNYESYNRYGNRIQYIKDFIVYKFDKGGNIASVESYNDKAQKHGQSCKYSYGKPSEYEYYLEGKLNGFYIKFGYNNFIEIKGEFKDGEKVSVWEKFDNDGVLSETILYLNKSRAIYLQYHKNQKLASEYNLVDNCYDGLYKTFYENGLLKSELVYKNGNIVDGKYSYFYETGEKKIDIQYKNGKVNGQCLEYYRGGKVKINCNYNDGELFGSYFSYNQTGSLELQGIFQKGKYKNNRNIILFDALGNMVPLDCDYDFNSLEPSF